VLLEKSPYGSRCIAHYHPNTGKAILGKIMAWRLNEEDIHGGVDR
jgi:hypothetical protein